MHAFTDNLGRVWAITINVSQDRRCRALAGVNLFALVERDTAPLAELLSDPVKLADTLYVLCKDEAATRNVTDDDFGRGLAGDAFRLAAEAFVGELIDFFPDPKRREVLHKLVAKTRAVGDLLATEAMARVEAIDPARLLQTLRDSSGRPPESSASTLAPSL